MYITFLSAFTSIVYFIKHKLWLLSPEIKHQELKLPSIESATQKHHRLG